MAEDLPRCRACGTGIAEYAVVVDFPPPAGHATWLKCDACVETTRRTHAECHVVHVYPLARVPANEEGAHRG